MKQGFGREFYEEKDELEGLEGKTKEILTEEHSQWNDLFDEEKGFW